jgi:hypothetical protein
MEYCSIAKKVATSSTFPHRQRITVITPLTMLTGVLAVAIFGPDSAQFVLSADQGTGCLIPAPHNLRVVPC